jgi:2-polyprenyl-3-methyl-5-hydroxy-6-metoxy-1,4-benzoquinol methylase
MYATYTELYTPDAMSVSSRDLEANARPLLARMAGWLPSNSAAMCLDAACGAGSLLFALRGAGYSNLFGVDRSAQQVSFAKQLCPQVEQGDVIEFLRRNSNRFDLITAFDIFEHLEKREVFEFADAIFFALRPGGRLIVQTPNADSPWIGSVRYGDVTHELAFTPASLERTLKVVGFAGYEARECAPFVHGLKSGARHVLWQVTRAVLLGWNFIETGSKGSGVLTRVFIAKADKPA